MRASNLHELWSSPDNSRLTTKQFSFRLPTHVAAKIAALCEIFPNKNRTQVVADLLSSALDELEKSLPEGLGEEVDPHMQEMIDDEYGGRAETHYYMGGLRGRFRELANMNYAELEKDLGNEEPQRLYEYIMLSQSHIEKTKK